MNEHLFFVHKIYLERSKTKKKTFQQTEKWIRKGRTT